MTRRLFPAVALITALLVAGCASGATIPDPTLLAAQTPAPPETEEITTPPEVEGQGACGDAEASLRPGVQPPPGVMPPGSSMAAIVANGKVRVGVDQNTYLFGFRDPDKGTIEGFDIDIAHEIARDLFGDPNRIELRTISAAGRLAALRDNQVDLVVQTFSATCQRRRDADFSGVYYRASQRILVHHNSGITSSAGLAGKRVCVTRGATAAGALFELPVRPTVIGVANWTDCLLALQQGIVDAVSADNPILYGLVAQDRHLAVVGDEIGTGAYAVGMPKGREDLVRFVNGVLERIRADGTWQRSYDKWLSVLGPAGPPTPRYQQ